MNATTLKIGAAAALAAALALAGCGGSDDDDDNPPAASLEVPDSAGASSAALTGYLQSLGSSDERSEPLRIKDGFTLPQDEDAEPIPLT